MSKKQKCRCHYLLINPCGLSPVHREKIAKHAVSCKSCRKEWHAYLIKERNTLVGRLIVLLQFQAKDILEEESDPEFFGLIPWQEGLETLRSKFSDPEHLKVLRHSTGLKAEKSEIRRGLSATLKF